MHKQRALWSFVIFWNMNKKDHCNSRKTWLPTNSLLSHTYMLQITITIYTCTDYRCPIQLLQAAWNVISNDTLHQRDFSSSFAICKSELLSALFSCTQLLYIGIWCVQGRVYAWYFWLLNVQSDPTSSFSALWNSRQLCISKKSVEGQSEVIQGICD